MKGKRKLQQRLEAEPKAVHGLPPCPRHLNGLARRAWSFWTEELEFMGLDRRPDAMMLEGACLNYARAVQAEKVIDRVGPVITESIVTDDGQVVVLRVKAHPAGTIAVKRWTLVKGFCTEFGLSPVSRVRLTIEKKDDSDVDLMAMLSGPREPRPAPVVN
jgi:P27 family predicted phage terminase small subunit